MKHVAFRKTSNWLRVTLKLLIQIEWGKCFYFSFASSLYGLRLGHETGRREGAEGKNINNCKHKCYVASCLGMLLFFSVLKGCQD